MNFINEWLFNANIIDMVLRELMEKGLKAQGGDKLDIDIREISNYDNIVNNVRGTHQLRLINYQLIY